MSLIGPSNFHCYQWSKIKQEEKGILENKIPSTWLHCASILLRRQARPQFNNDLGLQISAQGCRKESTLFSTEPRDTKCMRNMANETRNTAEDERLSTKVNVHHLPKYLHLVLVMLLEITGRCHDFSYWAFKHSPQEWRCASSVLFSLPTTRTLGFWWELEVKHLLKSLWDQRHLIQSNFQATPAPPPARLKCVSFTWR